MDKKPAWWNLFLGVVALVAAYVFPQLVAIGLPVDQPTFVAIVQWLLTLAFSALFGWQVKTMRAKMQKVQGFIKVSDVPPWVDIVLGTISLIASYFWPTLAGANPPFDESTFIKIVVWLGTVLLTAVFGWNVKNAQLKILRARGEI